MEIELQPRQEHLLIMGAGASVDYALPTWDKLAALIEQRLKRVGEEHKYREEILFWMSKIGKDKEHDTIDQCITKESRSKQYRSNGLTIENNIFLLMKEIFEELYKENDEGWVNKLNQKILDNKGLENEIAFINYNYDNVLDDNFLHFEYLTEKERIVDYRSRILSLSEHYVPAYFPHGNFFSQTEVTQRTHLYRRLGTRKSGLNDLVDAISCYESERLQVTKYGQGPVKLYILGLGGGLRVNLSNIAYNRPVSEVNVTIKDESRRHEILTFLSEQYGISTTDIKVFTTCEELIDSCF